MKKISICIPCYNEELNIENMYNAVKLEMSLLKEFSYEIIFADNASTDNSEKILKKIAKDDTNVKLIFNMRNFGPMRSGLNYIRHVSGDAMISLPCDFQEPPEMIPELIKAWLEGNKVVFGMKTSSEESKLMFRIRGLYYKILSDLSENPQCRHITGFGILDREVLENSKKYEDMNRGLKIQITEMGYPIKTIPYKQKERKRGKSSYTLSKYVDHAINTFTNTSIKPLRIITVLGMVLSVISSSFVIFLLLFNFLGALNISIVTHLLSIMIFMISLNIFFIGVIGEYVQQILSRVVKKPMVIERELVNFD